VAAFDLRREQCEQPEPAEQVRGDDRRVELHRHRQRAERSLNRDPDERRRRPPGRDARAAVAPAAPRVEPACDREHRDQHADAGRQVAVDHLDPRLAVRHRAARQRGLGGVDLLPCADRTCAAVAARLSGQPSPRVGQPGEGAEQHQIDRQKVRQQGQRPQPADIACAAVSQPDPGERSGGEGDAHQRDAQDRRQVVERLRVHA
jgi:hypothetical protein